MEILLGFAAFFMLFYDNIYHKMNLKICLTNLQGNAFGLVLLGIGWDVRVISSN